MQKIKLWCKNCFVNGDVVNPGGAITGGATKQKKSGLLEQKLQVEDLQSDIEVMKKKLEDMEIYWGKVHEEHKKFKIRSILFKFKRIDCKLIEMNIVENLNLLR